MEHLPENLHRPISIVCRLVFSAILALMLLAARAGADPSLAAIEAGAVDWGRDFDSALEECKATGRPLLVLFQEIPGCIGCKTFGAEVLSQPLMVEAIESAFIPVLVYNNRPGTTDEQLLRRYDEPAWNYQVIRFLNAEGDDIIPRRDKIWTVSAVAKRMIEALEAADRRVPQFLRMLMLEHDRDNQAIAAFAMACYWTGEHKLGGIEGVVTTEAGWYDNREVTLVTYHTGVLPLQRLIERAAEERCAQRVYLPENLSADTTRFTVKPLRLEKYQKASSGDQKKHLQNRPAIGSLKTLTPMQATKINSLSPQDGEGISRWLSPRQLATLSRQ